MINGMCYNNAKLKPLLKTEDLMLIRKGFMEMAIRERYSGDVGRARELMKRMLRRVG